MSGGATMLAAHPLDLRQAVESLGQGGHGPFGRRTLQHVVGSHLETVKRLLGLGATIATLARLLAEVGGVSPDGTDVPVGTSLQRAQSGPA